MNEQPPRIKITLNPEFPEFVEACRQLNKTLGQAYVAAQIALVQEFARLLNQPKDRP